MGVCLRFNATEPLSPAKSEAIIADANSAVRGARQPWLWCEPLHFFRPESDGNLLGSSKLNLIACPDDRADAARYPHAENDIKFLLKQLCRLSREHGVNWELRVDSEPLGTIIEGTCEPGLEEAIDGLAEMGEEFGDLELDELGLNDLP